MKKVKAGDPISAKDWNEIIDTLIGGLKGDGANIVIKKTSGGAIIRYVGGPSTDCVEGYLSDDLDEDSEEGVDLNVWNLTTGENLNRTVKVWTRIGGEIQDNSEVLAIKINGRYEVIKVACNNVK